MNLFVTERMPEVSIDAAEKASKRNHLPSRSPADQMYDSSWVRLMRKTIAQT